jgi:hypothetical protein
MEEERSLDVRKSLQGAIRYYVTIYGPEELMVCDDGFSTSFYQTFVAVFR